MGSKPSKEPAPSSPSNNSSYEEPKQQQHQPQQKPQQQPQQKQQAPPLITFDVPVFCGKNPYDLPGIIYLHYRPIRLFELFGRYNSCT